eukprot:159009-Rhodomonas_salina.2
MEGCRLWNGEVQFVEWGDALCGMESARTWTRCQDPEGEDEGMMIMLRKRKKKQDNVREREDNVREERR